MVAYDDQVRLVSALGPVGPELLSSVGAIYDGGSTNLSGGWLKGVEELRRATDGIRRVVLLTDGLANVGDQRPGAARRHGGRGRRLRSIGTTTIGFGDGFNEELLTAMADAGKGRVLLRRRARRGARDLRRRVRGAGVAGGAEPLGGDPPLREGRAALGAQRLPPVTVPGGVQLELGDVYGGEVRRIVFRLHVPGIADLGPSVIGEVVMRWTAVGGKKRGDAPAE